jgi:hypothetical protein
MKYKLQETLIVKNYAPSLADEGKLIIRLARSSVTAKSARGQLA